MNKSNIIAVEAKDITVVAAATVVEVDVVATALVLLREVTGGRIVMKMTIRMSAAVMKIRELLSWPSVPLTRRRTWLWMITIILHFDRIMSHLYSDL